MNAARNVCEDGTECNVKIQGERMEQGAGLYSVLWKI